MKRLLLLSPLVLAACVAHVDECVTIRPCGPEYGKECVCGPDRKDAVDRKVSAPPVDRGVVDDGGGREPDGGSDDTNGDVSKEDSTKDANSDKSSDKNADRPRKHHSRDANSGSYDGNGGSSDGNSSDENGGES